MLDETYWSKFANVCPYNIRILYFVYNHLIFLLYKTQDNLPQFIKAKFKLVTKVYPLKINYVGTYKIYSKSVVIRYRTCKLLSAG